MGRGTLRKCDCFGGLWGLRRVGALVGRAGHTYMGLLRTEPRMPPGSPTFALLYLAKILHVVLYLCNILVNPCQDVRVRLLVAQTQ